MLAFAYCVFASSRRLSAVLYACLATTSLTSTSLRACSASSAVIAAFLCASRRVPTSILLIFVV